MLIKDKIYWDREDRSSRPEVFFKKGVLENFAEAEACNFIEKETLAQVFSYEFCEISKNTFFTEYLGDCFWKE